MLKSVSTKLKSNFNLIRYFKFLQCLCINFQIKWNKIHLFGKKNKFPPSRFATLQEKPLVWRAVYLYFKTERHRPRVDAFRYRDVTQGQCRGCVTNSDVTIFVLKKRSPSLWAVLIRFAGTFCSNKEKIDFFSVLVYIAELGFFLF